MTFFIIAAFLLIALVLVLLFRPYIWTSSEQPLSRRQFNAVIYKEELLRLEHERNIGLIDENIYTKNHLEMRQRLLQDVAADDMQAVSGSPKKTIISLIATLPLAALLLYLLWGSAANIDNIDTQKHLAQQDVEKMVCGLAAKLAQSPNDLKGWAMLGRSYKVLGRPVDAEQAYEHAGVYLESDAQLLADYADIAATNANGHFVGKPDQLIKKALKIDPENQMALWLAGTSAYNKADYKSAIQIWQRLATLLPSDSDDARLIQGSILEAQSKALLPALAKSTQLANDNQNHAAVSGVVVLDPQLKSNIKPDDVVMVIARDPNVRMPVAIMRIRAAELPVQFLLNDALAMTPDAPISALAQVTVEVRISKSGQAKAETGDLMSAMQQVKVGSANLKFIVDQIRP